LPGDELGDDVWTGPAREGSESDIGIRWRVEGTEGLARGTIGWPSYPARTPSTLDFTTKRQPGYWLQPRWKEVWFPDAFVGTMAQLLCAWRTGRSRRLAGAIIWNGGALRGGVRSGTGASRDDGARIPQVGGQAVAGAASEVDRFLRVALQRLEDAEVLLTNRRTTGAIYMAGYAVECAMKGVLLAHVPRSNKKRLSAHSEVRSVTIMNG